jgi:hypothetical protein
MGLWLAFGLSISLSLAADCRFSKHSLFFKADVEIR